MELQTIEYVFIVQFSWNDGESGDAIVDLVTKDYELALDRYKTLVKDCIEDDCSSMFEDKERHIAKVGYCVEEVKNKLFFVYEEGLAATNFERITLHRFPVNVIKK